MIMERATAVRCAITAILLIAISLAALTVSRVPDARVAVHRAMSPKQIVAESHRAFEISARQP